MKEDTCSGLSCTSDIGLGTQISGAVCTVNKSQPKVRDRLVKNVVLGLSSTYTDKTGTLIGQNLVKLLPNVLIFTSIAGEFCGLPLPLKAIPWPLIGDDDACADGGRGTSSGTGNRSRRRKWKASM